jgi:hypothetical protein
MNITFSFWSFINLKALQRLENSHISWWNRSLLLRHCLLTLNIIFLVLEFALHNGSFVEKRTTFTIYEDKYRINLGFHKLTSISIYPAWHVFGVAPTGTAPSNCHPLPQNYSASLPLQQTQTHLIHPIWPLTICQGHN